MQIVFLTLCATSFMQLGYFLWKLAADRLPRIGEAPALVCLKAFFTDGIWLLGMALRLLGLFLFIKASAIGELSLIQPFMAIGDVFFVFLVVVFLKERLVQGEWVGVGLTFLGAMAMAFEIGVIGTSAMNDAFANIFMFLSLISVIACIVLVKYCKQSEVFWGIAVGIIFAVGGILIKMMTTQMGVHNVPVSVLSVISNSFLPFIVVCNIVGLVFLQMGFQQGRAAVIFPIQFAVTVALSVVAGMVLFHEYVSLYRISCIATIIVGTVCFQYFSARKQHSTAVGR